uniref:PARP4 MVP-ID C-terminal domain-containing protein n=1 Tax=Vannella robusta TaxID=1487602 RepID=A0A7S4I509_9EUKA|mmetsp:Transcript_20517/g.25967  ORF Transcript_20517/g.25967 Transcript_20517/m.25967 type:complete len:241 (+) Transcript_20517:175-897(+)
MPAPVIEECEASDSDSEEEECGNYEGYACDGYMMDDCEWDDFDEITSLDDVEEKKMEEATNERMENTSAGLRMKQPKPKSRDKRGKKTEAKPMLPDAIQYEQIIACQTPQGFWELSPSLEQHLGFEPNTLLSLLQAVGYRSIGESKAKEAERQLVTAIVIEAFLQSDSQSWKNCSAVISAQDWLRDIEKSDVSSCYILGLSSNWRAYARQILATRSFDSLEQSSLNSQVSISSQDLWIGF